jgi:hypothetical protein
MSLALPLAVLWKFNWDILFMSEKLRDMREVIGLTIDSFVAVSRGKVTIQEKRSTLSGNRSQAPPQCDTTDGGFNLQSLAPNT